MSGAYQSVLIPGDTSLLVGVGVGVALGLTGLAAEETVQVGADLVATVSLNGVALSATSLDAMSVYCPVREMSPCDAGRSQLTWKSLAPLAESPESKPMLASCCLAFSAASASLFSLSAISSRRWIQQGRTQASQLMMTGVTLNLSCDCGIDFGLPTQRCLKSKSVRFAKR